VSIRETNSRTTNIHPEDSLSLGDYLRWQRKFWRASQLGSNPNRFEVATATALWWAMRRATSGTTSSKFVSVSAATGSGKTYSAAALLAYIHSQGRRASMLVSNVHEIGALYDVLIRIMPRKALALWSEVHREDHDKRARQKHYRTVPDELKMHFKDPPRFSETECRNATILLTTHESWFSELDARLDLHIGRRGLILADEDPKLQIAVPFTGEDIHALLRVCEKRAQVANALDHSVAKALKNVFKKATQFPQAEAGSIALRGFELVTTSEADALAGLTYDLIAESLGDKTKRWSLDSDRHWDVIMALKAAGQGRIVYSVSTKSFVTYLTAFPPVPGLVVLDAMADLPVYPMSDAVYVPECVPPPLYSNVRLRVVYPPEELQGRLRLDGLYKRRSNVEKVYSYTMELLRSHVKAGSRILVCAPKQLVDKISRYDDLITDSHLGLTTFVHHAMVHRFNEPRVFSVYARLADPTPKRAATAFKPGTLFNRVFSIEDLRRFSSNKMAQPESDEFTKLQLLAHFKRDLVRCGVRAWARQSDARQTLHVYLIDVAPVVRNHLCELWPGAPAATVIGRPKILAHLPRLSTGVTRLTQLLNHPHGILALTPAQICQRTGLRRRDLPEIMRTAAVKKALVRWRKVPLDGRRSKSWKLEYCGTSQS
jgi:hypothetical protein